MKHLLVIWVRQMEPAREAEILREGTEGQVGKKVDTVNFR